LNFAGKFQFSHFGTDMPAGIDLAASEATAHGGGTVVVPEAHLLFSGDYKRAGVDLVLSKDGHDYVVPDYFKGSARATLSSPDGARLSGDLVTALTGEVQVAQLGGGANAAAQVIGTVTKLTGSATAIRNGVSVMLNTGDNVQKGDVVQAGPDSALGLTFIDGTVFGLSANARMVLNEMIYDPNGSANSSLLSLVQGTITFVAGETAKRGDMRVDTPVATMGIRGTAVLVEIGFEVPGQGGAPPVRFQVLVEPGGHVGSYVLYSKSDPNVVIGTVNQAGQLTMVSGNGDTSTGQAPPLSPEAIVILGPVFQQYFNLPSPNPRGTSPGSGSAPSDPNIGTTPEPLKFNPFQDLTPEVPKTVPISVPGAPPGTPPVNVTLTRVNTPPTIETAKISVAEGGTALLTAANFIVSDPDSTGFTFKVSNVSHGAFQVFNGTAWVAATSFTTADLNAGNVRFVHDGSEASPTFSVQADDGVAANNLSGVTPGSVEFAGVNDAPVMTKASLAVAEGGTVVLTAANIGVTDPDSSSFTFKVSAVTHGTFQVLNGENWVAATSFTSADLAAGRVRFVHDGGEAAPTFSIQADDGAGANHLSNVLPGGIEFVNINDAPVITAASLAVAQGGTVVITLSDVGITDPDSSSFTFYATATHGTFELFDGEVWVPITGSSVTSADIAAGHVRFHHDGSGYPPEITVVVSDGSAISAPFVAEVEFTPTNTIYHLTSTQGVSIDISSYGATNGFVLPGAGNVTTPGTPEDRIVLGYDLGANRVVLNGAPMMGDLDFTPISSSQVQNEDGSNSVHTVLGARNNVTLTQTVTLGADANFFTTTIDIFNGGTSALTNVRFMRNIDPDQDYAAHGEHDTYNDVIHVPTELKPFAIVSATGVDSGTPVALIGLSGNWRGSSYGFTNTDPYAPGAFDSPQDPNGAAGDQAISLTYDFGTIGAGQHAVVTYITTNNVATAGDNALFGTDGADIVNGFGGNDLLIGLDGADTFVFTAGSGHDAILDFSHNERDTIDLKGVAGVYSLADVLANATQDGADTVLIFGSDTIRLVNVTKTSLVADDFHFGVPPANHAPEVAATAPTASLVEAAGANQGTAISEVTLAPSDIDAGDTVHYDTTGWSHYAYFEFIGEAPSWTNARAHALAAGGYLANITSSAENAVIENLLYAENGYIAFTGGTDRDHEGQFTWTDGPEAGQALTYTNWQATEPNNVLASPNDPIGEDFLAIEVGAGPSEISGRWNDLPEAYPHVWGYVVEYDSYYKAGVYGSVLLDPTTNKLTYRLDNHDADTQALAEGQQVTDTFNIVVKDNHGATTTRQVSFHVTGTNDAPVIGTENLSLFESGGHVTLSGMHLSDADSNGTFNFAVTEQSGSVTPASGSGDLAAINAAFQNGITYTPDPLSAMPNPVLTENVALTVTDSHGASDTVNFIFAVAGTGPIVLAGTAGKDVILATYLADTMTGGAGADQFVFANNFGQHTITDFTRGQDRLDLHMPGAPADAEGLSAWLDAHASQSGADTLIHLDAPGSEIQSNTILLQGVTKANLAASDFILHPSYA
jgi:VCBS repeat-containing protein